MANAFQTTAFQHPGFQGSGGTVVIPPKKHGAGGRKRYQRKAVVEIDGERFSVWSEREAEALFAQAKAAAEEAAPKVAKTALNRSRRQQREGKRPTMEVAVPEIRLISGDNDLAPLITATQRMVDEIYLRAARDAELALELRRAIARQQEEDEDEVTILLLH